MTNTRITALRNKIKQYNIDGYIIPKNDEFFSENVTKDRLKIISNFNGSAGLAIVLKKKNYLFVDGRYTVQAHQQSNKNFKIVEIHKFLPKTIIRNLVLGYDPSLFTSKTIAHYFGDKLKLKQIEENLIDGIYQNKKTNKNLFFSLDKNIIGETHLSKIKRIKKILKINKADYLFISAPENVAWTLNIRGWDSPNSPVPNCRLIVKSNGNIYLIADKNKTTKLIEKKKLNKKQIIEPEKFKDLINNLKGQNFIVDQLSCSVLNESIIKSKFKIISINDPCYKLKSIKNIFEIKHSINTHIKDGVALTKFLFWIKNSKKKKITEMDAEKKLEMFRKLDKKYLKPSFNTIAGTGPNAALPHYRSTIKSNRLIKKNDIFLCDSGGQYEYGTTDVTRTICFSKPKKKIQDIFTKVLKGHIAVATSNLNIFDTGKKIDVRARQFLKKEGLDYEHGTGHGVGFFSNVHEGPQSISKNNNIKLEEGMILSNEPGYYETNHFGIRIENLVFVKKNKNNLYFKNLTLVPIDKDLINFNLLNKNEQKYLSEYHLDVYSKISKYLNNKEKDWLTSFF